MTKILKKMILIFCCIMMIGVMATPVKAATFDEINQSGIFVKQQTNYTCTLASAVMLVRRAALASGNSNWASITESSMRGTAWLEGSGLYYSFSYAGISVSHAALSGTSHLISLLNEHPEGIIIYNTSRPHAILVTDYTDGTFYCADPANNTPAGRIPISSASITAESCSEYWYVSSPKVTIDQSFHIRGYVDVCESRSPGMITVGGWVFDRDDPGTSIKVYVYVGGPKGSGVQWFEVLANSAGEDVNNAFGITGNHRFSADLYVSASGNQDVYLYGIDVNSVESVLLEYGHKVVNITQPKKYSLDLNGFLDGTVSGTLGQYGTCDLYIDGVRQYFSRQNDYWLPEVNQGSSYEFKNIVPNDGYSFDGVYSGQLKGTVSGDTSVVLSFSKHDLSSITETPEKVAYNGHTYMLYSTPVTWYFAKDFCHTKGGHLVEIDNLEENAFVASLCAEKERVWLGATDLDEDIDTSWLVGPGDPWYWETGRSFKLATSDIPWDTGQPDNYQEPGCDYENYAELFSATGKWNDMRGNFKNPFVLEIDWVSEEREEDLHGYEYVPYRNHEYRVFNGNVSWEEAERICEENGGHLVTISDAEEQSLVESLISSGSNHIYYIGGADIDQSGNWTWVTGEEFSYNKWNTGTLEPSKEFGKFYAAIISTRDYSPDIQSGRWISVPNIKYGDSLTFGRVESTGFVCEYDTDCSHEYGWEVTKEPTEERTGSIKGICPKCSTERTVYLPKLSVYDYSYTIETEPTCAAEGLATWTWKRTSFGNISFNAAIEKTDQHAWDDGKVTKEPSLTEEGEMTYTCSVCHETKTEPIPVLQYVPGDVTGDADVTIGDVVKINRHVIGKIQLKGTELLAADVTGDEDVTIADVVKVNRFVIGKISSLMPAANSGALAGASDLATQKEDSEKSGEALAGAGAVVQVGIVTVDPGENATIPIMLSGNPGIAGMALAFTLPEGVVLQEIIAGDVLAEGVFTVNENVVSWYTSDNIFTDGLLMNLVVSAEVPGSYAIAAALKDNKPSNLSDENGEAVEVIFENGTLQVEKKEMPEPLAATLKVSNVSTKANASKTRTGTLKISYDGDGELTFASSSAKITVDENGKFTIPKNYAGSATITVKAAATEQYKAAEAAAKITVKRLANTISANDVTKTAAAKAQSFTLSVEQKGTGKLTYKSSSSSVKVADTGKVTIAKNFSGWAAITITAAKAGIYNAAAAEIVVTVKPAAVTVGTAKNVEGQKIALTWKKAAGAGGYQIQYSTSKTFKSNVKSVTVKSAATVKGTLTKLVKGKPYYIRIRAYKKDAAGNLFSKWANIMAVKVTR